MAEILEISDQAAYFPAVKASGGALLAAISRAIATAEGPMGADRPLGITEYIESPLMQSNMFILDHGPLVADEDGNPDLVIQSRLGAGRDGFGRTALSVGNIQYRAVDPSLYEVDVDSGEILFSGDAGIAFINAYSAVGFGSSYRFSNQWVRGESMPTSENLNRSQIRVVYKAGYDFGEFPLSRDAATIKSLVAELLMISDGMNSQGDLKKEEIVDFHSFEYSNEGFNSRMENTLLALKQFS